ncbi:MAG TPA: hypothetical protein VMS09_09520 [Paenibacillus sp.]|uniref:hypothetical protein n=1 Tax=Paenibacillus sp. TaxID=58172 RepID=UPI002BABFDEF|nr:hypothetical protein [Paenibacillus sp.]HUC92254.1 hypothetical protein [Paenibacillus sp.]
MFVLSGAIIGYPNMPGVRSQFWYNQDEVSDKSNEKKVVLDAHTQEALWKLIHNEKEVVADISESCIFNRMRVSKDISISARRPAKITGAPSARGSRPII